ncbi:MAG: hypothetical protein PVG93_06940 [Phycisphaerales bacterium]|jgi:hypothetical protein
MTRRKFLDGILRTGSAVVVLGLSGVRWLAGKTLPRRFVRAARMNKYPGSIKQLGEINEQSKWSG